MCQPQPSFRQPLRPGPFVPLREESPRRASTGQEAHGGLALLPAFLLLLPLVFLLLLYAMSHSQAVWEAALAAARELNQDHAVPTRDLGRALSLVRALRNRQAPEADMLHATSRLAGHELATRLSALPRLGQAIAPRLMSRLMPLLALMGWLR